MKKVIAIFCVISMVFSFAACGAKEVKPEATVTTFCDGMKAFDFAKMQGCVKGEFKQNDVLDTSDDMPEAFLDSMKSYAASISYTVGTSTIDGEAAKVPVTFKYTDASALITATLGDYLTKAIGLAFSGGDTSDEAMSDLLMQCYNDNLNSAETKTAESSITFDLVKENDAWKIVDVKDELVHILTSNILKAFADWESEDTGSSEPEYIGDPNFVWNDVAIGETAQFATIKLTLTDCTETKELKGSWDSVKADEGTKFIVFTYTVENITKNEEYFSSDDFKLYDSQDREFSTYEDAFWYNEDVLVYEALAPNMPKKCASIYNVPENAEGYYMVGAKSDSNEYFLMHCK